MLDELHEKYTGDGKSVDSNDPIAPIQMPRGYGGTAIVWKKQGTSNYRNAPELPKCPPKLPKCPMEKPNAPEN